MTDAVRQPALRTGTRGTDEGVRRLVHLTMGLPALGMPWLSWQALLAAALLGAVVNTQILPHARATRRWFRDGETWGGIAFYPLVVASLLLVFRERTFIVAGAWLAMAFGDSAAAAFGRRFPITKWRWNAAKSVGGSAAFLLMAFAGLLLARWRHDGFTEVGLGVLAAAAAAAALVESLPARLDDNLTTAWTVALVLFGAGA